MLKRRSILFLYWVLWFFPLTAQQPGLELLRSQLTEAEDLLNAAHYQQADSLLASVSDAILASGVPKLQAELYRLNGHLALEQGAYDRSMGIFRQAVDLAERSFTARHPAVGQAYNDLGHYYFSTGQLDSALHYHRRALAIRLENFGPSDPKVADSNNNLGNVFQTAGRSSEALVYYEKALAIRQEYAATEPAELASSLNNIGNAYLSLGQLDRATRAFRRTLDIRMKVLGPDHPGYGRSLQNLGNTFYQTGTLDSAQFYYELALENAQVNYDTTHPQLANLYENLGNCALQEDRLVEAEQWHRMALRIREALSGPDPVAPASSYLHLGDIYRKKGDYLEAMRLTEKGWSILSVNWQQDDLYMADAWEKLGICHQNLGHFLEGRDALMTALEIRWKFFGPVHPLIAGSYTNLGNLFWQQSDHNSAIYYYQSALDIWSRYGERFQAEQANAYSNIGNSYLKEESWSEALAAYQRALSKIPEQETRLRASVWQQMGVAFDGLKQYRKALDAYETAMQFLDPSRQEQQNEYLFTLSARATTLLHQYETGRNNEILYLAEAAFDKSLKLLNERQLSLLHTESRQKEIALHYDLFEGAIACQLARWELENDTTYLYKALYWSEASKGLLLKEKWGEAPQRKGQTTLLATALRTDDATAARLQEQLRVDRGLLTFFAGSRQLFWFFLKGGHLEVGKIREVQKINQLVTELGLSLTQYPLAGSEQQVVLDSAYRSAGQELFQRVWLPIEKQVAGTPQLVIVPDGALAYLPFSVLLTEEPEVAMRYKHYPYLLKTYQFSYAYSTTSLARTLQLPAAENAEDCLAVAPAFTGHQPPLAPLTYNTLEVEELSRFIGATTLRADNATRTKFLELAPNFRILHLATHGVANIHRSEYSFLAFSLSDEDREGRLYVEDLYQMELPAEMIVMSACESGIGRFQAGEGAISLGRGFAAAGARSLIVTLWSVNDAKTASFMQAFYRELSRGITKDKAIWKVREKYLEKASQRDAHPFYWAPFLPLGDMKAIKLETGAPGWLIPLMMLILLGLGWWLSPRLLKNLSK